MSGASNNNANNAMIRTHIYLIEKYNDQRDSEGRTTGKDNTMLLGMRFYATILTIFCHKLIRMSSVFLGFVYRKTAEKIKTSMVATIIVDAKPIHNEVGSCAGW
jgi:hypothetical protein